MILLRVLGAVDLRAADGHEIRSILVQPKRLALLVYLSLASPRGFHRRESLMTLFWPELDSGRARNALSQALHVLRRGLGEQAVTNRGNEEVGLTENLVSCDAVDFATHFAAGRWAEALELYRGDLLEGFYVLEAGPELQAWVERERSRLKEMAVRAALELAAECKHRGELSLALHWAQRAGMHAPYDEKALRCRLAILEEQGDSAGALHAYETFAQRLRHELDVQPSESLQALARGIRSAQAASADLDAPTLGPSGDTRLVSGEKKSPSPSPAANRLLSRRDLRNLGIPALLVMALLLAGGTLLASLTGDRATPPPTRDRSVAVLPFVNLTGDPDQEFFSDGITEELLNLLSQVEGLRVAGRTSSFSFKGRDVPADSIGRALKVAYLLGGSVRESSNRLRITAQLIDARDGYQLWSDSYDREPSDALAVQDEIARAITQALRVRLADDTGRPLLTDLTPDPVAYDHYLRGLYLYNRRNSELAVARLEQAVARDPEFARAYAVLAHGYLGMPVNNQAFDIQTYMQKSREAVDRALELDPFLAEAHTALGILLYRHEWQFAAGEAEIRHAIDLNPNYAQAHEFLAQIQERSGRTEEAMESIERAEELDPVRPQTACMHAYLLSHARRYAEALRQYESALATHDFSCGEAAIEANYSLGRYREALTAASMHYQRVRPPEEATVLYRMAESVLEAKIRGLPPRSDLVLAVEQSDIPFERFVLAKWYTWAGDYDAALRVFEEMVEERHPAAIWLTFPFFDPLRSDPRYRALVAKMGIVLPSRA